MLNFWIQVRDFAERRIQVRKNDNLIISDTPLSNHPEAIKPVVPLSSEQKKNIDNTIQWLIAVATGKMSISEAAWKIFLGQNIFISKRDADAYVQAETARWKELQQKILRGDIVEKG